MYESKKKYNYGTGSIIINGREINDYFGLDTLKLVVISPWSLPIWLARSIWLLPSPAAAFPARLALSATVCPALWLL